MICCYHMKKNKGKTTQSSRISCSWQQGGVGVQTGLFRPFSACFEREKLIENPSFKRKLGSSSGFCRAGGCYTISGNCLGFFVVVWN